MTQKQVELQKLILMEQEREKKEQLTTVANQSIIPKKTMNFPLSETMNSLEKELNLDIFLSDKDLKKEKKSIVQQKLKQEIFSRIFPILE